jgi:hypothetical protein
MMFQRPQLFAMPQCGEPNVQSPQRLLGFTRCRGRRRLGPRVESITVCVPLCPDGEIQRCAVGGGSPVGDEAQIPRGDTTAAHTPSRRTNRTPRRGESHYRPPGPARCRWRTKTPVPRSRSGPTRRLCWRHFFCWRHFQAAGCARAVLPSFSYVDQLGGRTKRAPLERPRRADRRRAGSLSGREVLVEEGDGATHRQWPLRPERVLFALIVEQPRFLAGRLQCPQRCA